MIRQAAEVDRYYPTWNLSVEPLGGGARSNGKIPRGAMKITLFVVGSVLIVLGLMILQCRSLKKCHPNAELLIDMLNLLKSDSDKK